MADDGELERSAPQLPAGQQERFAAIFKEDAAEALRFIMASTMRMDHYVTKLLQLARLGRQELKRETLDMTALVEDVLQTLNYPIEQGDVSVTVRPLPPALADRLAMEQVWGNLLGNAIKYLEPGRPGQIVVDGRQEAGEVVCWIEDNGSGIAAEQMERVFAPFRRAGRPDVPGEGMGLAYAQTLIRRHDGRIWFESQVGAGSTFKFSLPQGTSARG